MAENRLLFGDNLPVLRQLVADGVRVDLVYLDPPFNSDRDYSVFFPSTDGAAKSSAQVNAFEDTWTWTQEADALLEELETLWLNSEYARAVRAVQAIVGLLGKCDATAYLVNMGIRLIELHRILADTGSLYLHCDPTMSHYLKIVLDGVFGMKAFRNELIWKRTSAHSKARRFGPIHDTLLFYTKQPEAYTWNKQYEAYDAEYVEATYNKDDGDGRRYATSDLTGAGVRNGESGREWKGFNPTSIGRHWAIPGWARKLVGVESNAGTLEVLDALDAAGMVYWPHRSKTPTPSLRRYLDMMPGRSLQDIILDIRPLSPKAAERLGYPTQKPLGLLKRLILASSNPGDIVLDPFCGCGATVDAAHETGRQWIGIDVAYIAVALIEKRLKAKYGPDVKTAYSVDGIPTDVNSAIKLWETDPYGFQCWIVTQLGGIPGPRGADRGVDGTLTFSRDRADSAVVFSVKGGKTLTPADARDLAGTVNGDERYAMGVLIGRGQATRGVKTVIETSGTFTDAQGNTWPRLQYVSLPDYFKGLLPRLPFALNQTQTPKTRKLANPEQPVLF